MGRPQKPVDPSLPYADLANALRALREQYGLTYRELVKRSKCPHSTLNDAARGRCFPRWEVVRSFVLACDQNLDEVQLAEWHRLWTDARDKDKKDKAKGNRS